MRKVYCKPRIQIQSIDSENLMDNPTSIPMFSDETIIDDSEILINRHSIWDDEWPYYNSYITTNDLIIILI